MTISPEDRARENIDRLLIETGWIVQPRDKAKIVATPSSSPSSINSS